MSARAILLGALMTTSPASAATYGDTLLSATVRRHPELGGIGVAATAKAGPIKLSKGAVRPSAITVPLSDAMGEPIGTVSLAFRREGSVARARAIAAEMARRIYIADNLGEADPFVAGAVRLPMAQMLVDRMIDATPDLVTLAMHVTPPGQATNIIVASNFGRIGKAADKDDAHVIADGAMLQEATSGGKRLAIELPMHDRAGATIGALSTSFAIRPGEKPAEVVARALAVRDALALETPSIEILAAGKSGRGR